MAPAAKVTGFRREGNDWYASVYYLIAYLCQILDKKSYVKASAPGLVQVICFDPVNNHHVL